MPLVVQVGETDSTILYEIKGTKYLVHFDKQSKSVVLMRAKGFMIISQHSEPLYLQAMLEVLELYKD